MKPNNLKTKIFLDSGDPQDSKQTLDLLGFLDGQTTNPSLIAKNPDTQGKKFTQQEILEFYKKVVTEISQQIPQGSVSIEVYADNNTTSDDMFKQGKEMFTWIPNAHIKYPTTTQGLKAAELSIKEGMRVNMTLVFNQEQAAAVHAATKGAKKGDVFVSPFIGRIDDKGENGMDLVKNIIQMYKQVNSQVEVLAASVRNLDHYLYSMALGADIITTPLSAIKEWVDDGMKVPQTNFQYNAGDLKPIEYQNLDLSKPWEDFNVKHELTDVGLEKFASDWNNLIK